MIRNFESITTITLKFRPFTKQSLETFFCFSNNNLKINKHDIDTTTLPDLGEIRENGYGSKDLGWIQYPLPSLLETYSGKCK